MGGCYLDNISLYFSILATLMLLGVPFLNEKSYLMKNCLIFLFPVKLMELLNTGGRSSFNLLCDLE